MKKWIAGILFLCFSSMTHADGLDLVIEEDSVTAKAIMDYFIKDQGTQELKFLSPIRVTSYSTQARLLNSIYISVEIFKNLEQTIYCEASLVRSSNEDVWRVVSGGCEV